MQPLVAVRRGTGETGRDDGLGEEERAGRVRARGFDHDLRGSHDVALAGAGLANHGLHTTTIVAGGMSRTETGHRS